MIINEGSMRYCPSSGALMWSCNDVLDGEWPDLPQVPRHVAFIPNTIYIIFVYGIFHRAYGFMRPRPSHWLASNIGLLWLSRVNSCTNLVLGRGWLCHIFLEAKNERKVIKGHDEWESYRTRSKSLSKIAGETGLCWASWQCS